MIDYELVLRRAYGWEVPTDKRVFLEGDVRLEIHSVKPLKNKVYQSAPSIFVHIGEIYYLRSVTAGSILCSRARPSVEEHICMEMKRSLIHLVGERERESGSD